jgi:thiamine biosynthesis protein ThiS
MVQVREPGLDRLPTELLIREIMKVVSPETSVVVNSDIALAHKLGIGIHLPESGPTIEEARSFLGAEALIGRSIHSARDAAKSTGASYLIAGHVFATGSKPDRKPLGLERLAEIVRESPAPVLAVGGITPGRISSVLAAGALGVAVMSPFTSLASAEATAATYHHELESAMTDTTTGTISATINGKLVELPAGTTVSAFLAGRELHERLVVVERNGEIIKRTTFPNVVVEEGDLLEIVHFVGGG